MITSNDLARNSDAIGVGNVSGRKANDSHLGRAEGSSVLFGAAVAEAVPVAGPVERGRRAVVSDPTSLCRASRYEGPSLVHLVISLALLFFAVAVSVL